MKQFLFIKRASEVYTIPASALKVVEYASDTSVALRFETHKDGKESTITVRLSITSGKAADVITAISSQIANSNATVFKYDDINDTFFTKNVTGVGTITVTTPTDSIEGVNVTSTGETGGTKFLREDGDGTCSFQTVSMGSATAITVADESSDTTCFPLFVTAATGDLAPKTGSNLSFNSSTGGLTVDGVITGKTYMEKTVNFYDDIGTSTHYLPLSDQSTSESTSYATGSTAWLAPCNGRIINITMKVPSGISSTSAITFTVQKNPVGDNYAGAPSDIEAETLSLGSDQDHNVAHWTFDNAAFVVGDLVYIKMVSDADPGGNLWWLGTVVIEQDWSTKYTGSSAIHT
tara:strand:- start:10288 stop:11331 length:1044 start_codon:yes stop_codon:yes gene_type:complete